ncbi:MAG: cyanophycin synthetase, partial [Microlunatus sp.]|nr:cyanophycin synthetase [Microlunatus sp.]
AHNVPALEMLGDFVDKTGAALDRSSELGRVSRIGVIATAGDRRNADMRELGETAAQHFDVVIVREDNATRGRRRGEVADLIAQGVHAAMGEGIRAKQVEIVLDELEATRHAMTRSNPGDLIVVCVDQHAAVMSELESYGRQAQPGARRDDHVSTNAVADPDFLPGPSQPEAAVEPSLF